MLSSKDIREGFLRYFEGHGHTRVKSAPLIPGDDPTLLFTNAGMNQFKDYFTGARPAPFPRACSSQKCVRAGGKHNDLENVGHTARHHTFFEMLGNFSFGDYFKEDACRFGWEFVTGFLKLNDERLWVTVFTDDDEAFEIWRDKVGVRPERIVRMGEKDNFWAMGDVGPCGPCSEIHYDQGDGPGGMWKGETIHGETDRFLEIWNLVFMQFERRADGSMHPLPKPSIDTGAGLERMTALCQGQYSNYHTDLFLPLLHTMGGIAGTPYGADPVADVSLRVVADHARAAAFLIGDNVFPSNDGRGYVLRRIMRRAIRHGKKLGVDRVFMPRMCEAVIDHMAEAYPDLAKARDTVLRWVEREETTFRQSLDKGLRTLNQELDRLDGQGGKTLAGGFVFTLYDQDGFPPDLTATIAAERGMGIDQAGFEEQMERQRQRGRASWKEEDSRLNELYARHYQALGPTTFTGYDATQGQATVTVMIKVEEGPAGLSCETVTEALPGDRVMLVTDITPFYGESGGQVSDTGLMTDGDGVELVVEETRKPFMDFTVHQATVRRGVVRTGQRLDVQVDRPRRDRIRANHSVTHLLHHALRRVLGDHVKQAGSFVSPERMRFDFSHFQAVSHEELMQIEAIVGELVRANHPVVTHVLPIEEARKRGALMFFGEKYADVVRMVEMGPSKELCGGTHAVRTGDIGSMRIVSEGAIAAGVRRIEAVTAGDAVGFTLKQHDALHRLGSLLHAPLEDLPGRVEKLLADLKAKDKELKTMSQEAARKSAGDIMANVRELGPLKVLAAAVAPMDGKALREFCFELRDRLGDNGVAVVVCDMGDGKANLAVAVGKEAQQTVHAGRLVSELAPLIGGKGGGKADAAQGGGADPSGIDALVAKAYEVLSP